MTTTIKYILLSLSFAPLLVDVSVFFPYITAKVMFIRLMVLLVGILFFLNFLWEKSFREKVIKKLSLLFSNPLFISVLLFLLANFLGTVLAVDFFQAFWGDVERGEGFVGLVYFFGFFLFSLLTFEEKEWRWFLRLSLISGLILFLDEIRQWLFFHQSRPSSFLGNPIYLGAYFLFIISAAIFVFSEKNPSLSKRKFSYYFWKVLAALIIPLSVVGILVTQTRGVILGLGVSILFLSFYFLKEGRNIPFFKKLNFQQLGAIVLFFVFALGVGFFLTKDLSFWQKIPGFDRLAKINFQDATLQTRLIALKIGLQAINPSNEGISKFIFGWGPDNFFIAYNKYYNPTVYLYENSWFDRAHNKLIDVLVMNGVLGLLFYLFIWIFFWAALLKKEGSLAKHLNFSQRGGLLFWGVAYFFQNLFVFDSIATYLNFFFFLALVVYFSSLKEVKGEVKEANFQKDSFTQNLETRIFLGKKIAYFMMFGVLILFFSSSFYFSLVAYSQMKEYLSALRTGNANLTLEAFRKSLTPYTYAQENIRTHFASYMQDYNGRGEKADRMILESLVALEGLVAFEKYDPRNFLVLSQSYLAFAEAKGDFNLLKSAEFYARKALELSPRRQNVRYLVGEILVLEGRLKEAVSLLRETLAQEPAVGDSHFHLALALLDEGKDSWPEAFDELEAAFSSKGLYTLKARDEVFLSKIYQDLFEYFLKTRDTRRFVATAQRLILFFPERESLLKEFIDVTLEGRWGKIDPNFFKNQGI